MSQKTILLAAAVVLALGGSYWGYRAYVADLRRDEARLRAAYEQQQAEARRADQERLARQETEARRLAELKAQQDAADAAREQARLQAEEAAA
ncbi:MAG TPA: hypothetical protein VMD31_05595, partial [Opitutaceae bacterium]|nr:hypothetical protein [Opitutaceae bacterium]